MTSLASVYWRTGIMAWDRAEQSTIILLNDIAESIRQRRSSLLHKQKSELIRKLRPVLNDQESIMDFFGHDQKSLRLLHKRQHAYMLTWLSQLGMHTLPSEVESVRHWWIEIHVARLDRALLQDVGHAQVYHRAV